MYITGIGKYQCQKVRSKLYDLEEGEYFVLNTQIFCVFKQNILTIVSLDIVGGKGSLGPASSVRLCVTLGLLPPRRPPHILRPFPVLANVFVPSLLFAEIDTDESIQKIKIVLTKNTYKNM